MHSQIHNCYSVIDHTHVVLIFSIKYVLTNLDGTRPK